MKKASILVLVALAVLLVGRTASAEPYKDKPNGRLLTGRVVDRQESALPSSVVYLTNTRTRAVKTYIVGNDGSYRFPELSPNIDYEVYALFQGHKSDTKTVSQFDNRTTVNINLKIDAK